MTPPPHQIDGARVLRYATVEPGTWRGRTRHVVDGAPALVPEALAVCQYEGDPTVYLFYCDSDWRAIADTAHGSTAAALDQARFEGGQEVAFNDAAA